MSEGNSKNKLEIHGQCSKHFHYQQTSGHVLTVSFSKPWQKASFRRQSKLAQPSQFSSPVCKLDSLYMNTYQCFISILSTIEIMKPHLGASPAMNPLMPPLVTVSTTALDNLVFESDTCVHNFIKCPKFIFLARQLEFLYTYCYG